MRKKMQKEKKKRRKAQPTKQKPNQTKPNQTRTQHKQASKQTKTPNKLKEKHRGPSCCAYRLTRFGDPRHFGRKASNMIGFRFQLLLGHKHRKIGILDTQFFDVFVKKALDFLPNAVRPWTQNVATGNVIVLDHSAIKVKPSQKNKQTKNKQTNRERKNMLKEKATLSMTVNTDDR
jgi:hypothetical protein